jgi:hypothetical protein
VGNATSTNLLIETFFTSSYYYINRTFLPFDTSSLPDDATLSSSTLYFVVEGYYDYGDVGTRKLALVQTSQPDNTVLTLADYNECGATTSPAEGADQVQYTATGTYAFTLNATGTSWISQTGITKLGIRSHLDVADTAPTDGVTELYVYLDKSNVADINKRPNLTIEYTTGGGEPEATASSCLPVAGQNWWMNLADNCISSTTIMHDKPIYCYGTGSWTIDGVTVQVTGTSSLCIPTVKSGAMEVEDLKEYIVNDLDQTIDSLDQGAGRFIIKL